MINILLFRANFQQLDIATSGSCLMTFWMVVPLNQILVPENEFETFIIVEKMLNLKPPRVYVTLLCWEVSTLFFFFGNLMNRKCLHRH